MEDAESMAYDAAHLIIGLPIPGEPDSLFLAQLMNSGLDVDKLDYMLREALFSGITLGISLQWLMKKLFIAMMPGSQLPKGLIPRIHGFSEKEQFAVLALERGGQFGFEEFCVARLALHEKIYLHQKIRAAEVQTKSLLLDIAKNVPLYSQVHRWLYLSESVAHPPEGELMIPSKGPLFESPFPEPSDMAWPKIRNRELPARAYAFGWQNSISDPLTREHRLDRRTGVDTLMDMVRENPAKFTDEIRVQVTEIARVLKLDEEIDPNDVDILVDPPRLSTIQQGHDTIHIQYPPRLSLSWMMPIDQIETYYYWNRALGYVFTSRDHVPYVLLAAEVAAWRLCQVVCVQEGLVNQECIKECKTLRKALDAEGFYQSAPPLRPVTENLEGVEAQIKVAQVAQALSSYESKSQKRVSRASVTTFVAQFPAELQDTALTWLQRIEFVRPENELKILIPAIVHELLPSYKSIGISPLGATTDSAFRLPYNLRDPLEEALREKIIAQQIPLAEALARELDAYLIFDDNTNTGFQALNILAGWLGKEVPVSLRLKEEHVQPLADPLKKELLSKPVFLAFAVAPEGSLAKLHADLVQHCGFAENLVHCRASKILTSEDKIFSADSVFQDKQKVKLRDFVAEVAETIFRNEGKTPETAKSRALGDGHAEAMIVFPYNCPTMTIPALWLAGAYKNGEWLPLVERGRRRTPKGELSGEDA